MRAGLTYAKSSRHLAKAATAAPLSLSMVETTGAAYLLVSPVPCIQVFCMTWLSVGAFELKFLLFASSVLLSAPFSALVSDISFSACAV